MSINECSCCYEEITAATGKAVMGCGHEFHFNCLATWFYKQCEGGGSETCPLCRREATALEQLPTNDADDEDEDEDEEDDYEEEDEINENEAIFTRAGIDAFLRSHGGLGVTEDLFNHWVGPDAVNMSIDHEDLNGTLMTQGAQPITEEEFRGLLRRVHGAPAAPATRWVRMSEGRWERVPVVPSEGPGPAAPAAPAASTLNAAAEPFVWDGMVTSAPPPDSLALQTQEAAKKIQAAYRGYKTYTTVVAAMGLLRIRD